MWFLTWEFWVETIQNLSHFENGCDVIAYFMLGRVKSERCYSLWENMSAMYMVQNRQNTSAYVEMPYDITFILKMEYNTIQYIITQ